MKTYILLVLKTVEPQNLSGYDWKCDATEVGLNLQELGDYD